MATKSMPMYKLNCGNCRQRKIKCDRVLPCAHCQRSGLECQFPKPMRQPGSKTRNAEITKRLAQLEQLVGRLGDNPQDTSSTTESPAGSGERAGLQPQARLEQPHPLSSLQAPSQSTDYTRPSNHHEQDPIFRADGSRYMSSDFWVNLSSEVEGLRQVLNEAMDDDEDEDESEDPSSRSITGEENSPGPSALLFGNSNPNVDMRTLSPYPPHIPVLCEIYFARVEALFKIVHRPSILNMISNASCEQINNNYGQDALFFAMYFAAITSLTEEECGRLFQQQRSRLLNQYRSGIEVALIKADFLNSTELAPLQAFILYLVCLRSHDGSRTTWTLFSVAVRLAFALELHRESASKSANPFEVEIRRRTWHQITVLDTYFCEDRGTAPLIFGTMADTRMPAECNDEDLDPSMTSPPLDRQEISEMSFSLLCQEAAYAYHRLMTIWSVVRTTGTVSEATVEEETILRESAQGMKAKFIDRCDETVPIQFVCATTAKIIAIRWGLHLRYPINSRRISKKTMSRPATLMCALSILELGNEIGGHPSCAPWMWYMGRYVAWYPIAVALAELCVQTSGPLVDRAWIIVEAVFDFWANRVADTKKGSLWQPIRTLLLKARRARLRALGQPNEDPKRNLTPSGALGIFGAVPYASDYGRPKYYRLHEASVALSIGVPESELDIPSLIKPDVVKDEPSASTLAPSIEMDTMPETIDWDDWTSLVGGTWDSGAVAKIDDSTIPWSGTMGL